MDTVSIIVGLVLVVALSWSIRAGVKRRERANRELAARKAAQAFNPRTLWFDEERRGRIAQAVKSQVSKHHDR